MLKKAFIALASAGIIYVLIALALVVSQSPGDATLDDTGGEKAPISFAEAVSADYSTLPEPLKFKARDGADLHYRRWGASAATDRILILVHGSAWNSMQWHPLASWIAGQGLATVIAPDMRGHGLNEGVRGDVAYAGQMEDDIADLIYVLKQDHRTARVILGGHSSGGGFVIRFAGGKNAGAVNGYITLAPFLKYNAPTTKPNSGGWAQVATRRVIGLTMLNSLRIKGLNHLPVISFAMPRSVLEGRFGHLATTTYSFRLIAGFSPRSDYEKDLAAIKDPLLVVAGDADEAFRAELYEPVISAQTKTGTYAVLPGVSHIGVVTGQDVRPVIAGWLRANFP